MPKGIKRGSPLSIALSWGMTARCGSLSNGSNAGFGYLNAWNGLANRSWNYGSAEFANDISSIIFVSSCVLLNQALRHHPRGMRKVAE